MVRLFGTNGIREVVGERLTASFVTSVVTAIARITPVGEPIAVGWDGRTSSPALARIVSSTLALGGHSVIELGLLPTPAIQYNMKAVGAQLGVIVTASHNPPEFNGLKCIARDGLEIARETEESIERATAAHEGASVPYDRVGEIREDPSGAERYLRGILRLVDRDTIARRRFRVILDCGNGASARTSPSLLRHLGCRFTTLNGHIDGTFPGHLSEPTEENLQDLVRTVPALGVDFGVAHDGDADRAVFVDGSGQYIPGERVQTLLARELVRSSGGGVVVTPVTTSQSVEDVVRAEGGTVVYTRVGSPSVTRAMLEHRAVFGGEENGGYIFPKFQLARDGAMTVAVVLDLLARQERSLAEALVDLPRYFLVKERIPCPVPARSVILERLQAELAQGAERVISLDGIKVYRSRGWVLLRPSGTEPLLRVFAEAKEVEQARTLAGEVVERVRELLQELADTGADPPGNRPPPS